MALLLISMIWRWWESTDALASCMQVSSLRPVFLPATPARVYAIAPPSCFAHSSSQQAGSEGAVSVEESTLPLAPASPPSHGFEAALHTRKKFVERLFRAQDQTIKAVDGVSLEPVSEILGLVGIGLRQRVPCPGAYCS